MTEERNRVEAALERLFAESDPADEVAFWGAQYDLGLAWVHFPVGYGGLGPFNVAAVRFFIAGIVIFCSTLYAIAFGAPGWLGAITPIGGVMFLLGWATMAWAVARR